MARGTNANTKGKGKGKGKEKEDDQEFKGAKASNATVRTIFVHPIPLESHIDVDLERLHPLTLQKATRGKGAKKETDDGVNTGDAVDANVCFGYERKTVEGWAEEANMGYLTLDILNPPEGTVWGHFNDRIINHSQVEALVESFKLSFDNCTNSTAMYIAVKPEWVSNIDQKVQTVRGKTIDMVPLMAFTPEGAKAIEDDNLWVLSGNHRRQALQIHVQRMQDKLDEVKEQRASMHSKQAEGGFQSDANAKEMQADMEVRQMEQAIAMTSRWAMQVYNRGAWRNGCGARTAS
jgi:hypothetical protein